MIRQVKSGRTLLVNGPASVFLVSGLTEVLGAEVNTGETIVVRNGRRLPFYVEEDASFEITCGEDSTIEDVAGDTMPKSWRDLADELLDLQKPTVVMIVGRVDSGKTSLCTFLANKAIKARLNVAVIDADLGQSDIGPPATIGLAYLDKPEKDLFRLRADDSYFIGLTSPSRVASRVAETIVKCKKEAIRSGTSFLVINTDGWVEGQEAVRYKVMLTESVEPSVVVGIRREAELEAILDKLGQTPVLSAEPPFNVRKRNRDSRRILRELSYKKHMQNAKIRVFQLGLTKVEAIQCSPFSASSDDDGSKMKDKERPERDERGLIAGLYDQNNRFLGLGVIRSLDYRRGIVKVSTPVAHSVAAIRIGKIRLDNSSREITDSAED